MSVAYATEPIRTRRVSARAQSQTGAGVEVLALLILLGGIGLRLMLFLESRPLWLDEAMLANNIRSRTFLQLFKPLDNHQGAPVGFLIAEKLLWNCLHTDWSLRLVSLVAGLATLLLIDVIVKSVLPGAGRVFAAMLAATSLPLIYYSTEIKPYALDVAIGLLIVVCAMRWANRRSSRALLALGMIGTLGVWFSYTAILVLGAVGVMLFIEALRSRDRKAMLSISGSATAWLLSFMAVYVLTMRHLSTDHSLSDYWEAGFMPYSRGAASWMLGALVKTFRAPGGFQSTKLAALSAFIGAIWLWRKRNVRLCGTLILIVVMPLIAAMLHEYPFAGRLILFIVPAEILLIACGVVGLSQSYRVIGIIVSLALALMLLRQTFRDLPTLFQRETARDASASNHLAELGIPPHEDMISAMNYLQDTREAGRDLYILDTARPAFEYYGATRFAGQLAEKPTFFGDEPDVQGVIARIAAHPRAAILLSHFQLTQDEPSVDLQIINALNAAGCKTREASFSGSCVICIDPR